MATQTATFGDLLRRLRRAAGLTQEALAERAGLSVGAIGTLECGLRRAPRRDTVMLLADALVLTDQPRAAFVAAARRARPPAPPTTTVAAGAADTPADFPLRTSLDRHVHGLPVPPTPMLGREREVADLCALVRRNDARLVTLTGPGGVGKTRLGLQVATELTEEFADGVWFVRLSHLADPTLVLPTIGQTLGLREAGGQSITALLYEHVRMRQLLLLLDTFEQVVGAALQLAELLASSHGLKVLVTTRVRLRLRGEKEYRVAPLALPPTDAITQRRSAREHVTLFPAVALFLQRARDARPDFQVTDATAPVVAAICARLDGLPLAIELATPKVRILPPPTLLARLERQLPVLAGGARDLEARQQTMRATLDWSEGLLSPDEKRLFRRLAVFVGGFTLEAAEAVCAAPEGAEPLGVEVLGGLESLVDQGLVQPWMVAKNNDREEERGERSSEARFRMLFVVREYALERLEASGEAEALQRAHAGYFLALAEPADWRMALRAAADRAGGALPAAPCAVCGVACCPTAAGTHEWHSAAAPAS